MVSRRRFEQIDVLEGINVLTTISGKAFLCYPRFLTGFRKVLKIDGLDKHSFL